MGASLTTKTRSRGRRTGGTYRPMAEINVTPFVDVMLVLLIVFMVAAPLLTSGVKVDIPESEAKAITDEDNAPIEITFLKNGKLLWGGTEIAENKLKFRLEAALNNGDGDKRVYIHADESLDYGRVMKLIGTINAAGFTKVALISKNTNR